MEYNTKRKTLLIPEYGRNIQKLAEYAMTIEDREKRTAFANMIVNTMAQLSPSIKDSGDYRHKLWDHLFIISDYKLDVDCPYPMPSKEKNREKPQPLHYKNSVIRFRPYGKIIENMIDKVIDMPESEEKNELVERIAQQLKKSYLQWNVNSCDDQMILEHFEKLSHGQLKLQEDFKLQSTKRILGNGKKKNAAQNNQNNGQKHKAKHQNQKKNNKTDIGA